MRITPAGSSSLATMIWIRDNPFVKRSDAELITAGSWRKLQRTIGEKAFVVSRHESEKLQYRAVDQRRDGGPGAYVHADALQRHVRHTLDELECESAYRLCDQFRTTLLVVRFQPQHPVAAKVAISNFSLPDAKVFNSSKQEYSAGNRKTTVIGTKSVNEDSISALMTNAAHR